jgi:hypothetical protein
MDLLQVEIFAEPTIPNLHQEGLAEVQELVLLVVSVRVSLFGEVFGGRHARRKVEWFAIHGHALEVSFACLGRQQRKDLSRTRALCRSIHDSFCGHEADEAVLQDLVRRIGVEVRHLILQDLLHVLAAVLEDELAAARVTVQEVGDIVDLGADCDIARFLVVV